jgi:Rrf2 family protein
MQAQAIARAEGVPTPVLRKVLHLLTRKRLLRARRGPGGGFCLARRPEQVSLKDVVAAVDGLEHLQECAVGLARCSDFSPCPLHHTWKGMREQVLRYLKTTSLAEMARALTRKKQLLTRKGRGGRKAAAVR